MTPSTAADITPSVSMSRIGSVAPNRDSKSPVRRFSK